MEENNFEKLLEIRDQFIRDLQSIGTNLKLGDVLIDIIIEEFRVSEERYSTSTPGFPVIKNEISKIKDQVMNIKENKSVNFDFLRKQGIVLTVSRWESFLGDVIICIFDNYQQLILPSDTKAKFTIELEPFRYSKEHTLGGVMLKSILRQSVEYNLQNIESSKKIFKQLFSINTLKFENEDLLTLSCAKRHLIVHSNSRVDHKFLRDIESTSFASLYEHGSEIETSEQDLGVTVETFERAAITLVDALINRKPEQVFNN